MRSNHYSGPPVDPDELRKLGFERRDVALKGIARWVFGFFLFGFASVVIAGIVFQILVPEGISAKPPRERKRIPPEPRLQDNVTAKLDMWEMRREESERLGRYGWVNREKGIVSIPIHQAIDLAAQGARPSSGPVADPGDPVPLSAEPGVRRGEQ